MFDWPVNVILLIVAAQAVWRFVSWATEGNGLHRACAIDIAPGARVGILITCDDTPTHTRHGAFRGYTRTFSHDWQLRAEVKQALSTRLQAEGLVTVDLRETGLPLPDCANLIELRHGHWHVADVGALKRLRDEFGLSALMVVRNARVRAFVRADEHGTSALPADGTGLFTLPGLFTDRYFAVVAQQWHVYSLDPAADLALAGPMRRLMEVPSVQLKTFRPRDDLQNLHVQELAPVREEVVAFIRKAAAAAVASLKSGGRQRATPAGPGGAQRQANAG